MRKAGRPRKNGLQPVWVLQRVTLALFAYERAREAGEKHCVAVSEAVKYIRKIAPTMRISETEVRRIVAYWRPRGATKCLLVREPRLEENTILALAKNDGVVSFVNRRVLYTAYSGPRPIYSRANAATKPTEDVSLRD